jgi:hypothetical protein
MIALWNATIFSYSRISASSSSVRSSFSEPESSAIASQNFSVAVWMKILKCLLRCGSLPDGRVAFSTKGLLYSPTVPHHVRARKSTCLKGPSKCIKHLVRMIRLHHESPTTRMASIVAPAMCLGPAIQSGYLTQFYTYAIIIEEAADREDVRNSQRAGILIVDNLRLRFYCSASHHLSRLTESCRVSSYYVY